MIFVRVFALDPYILYMSKFVLNLRNINNKLRSNVLYTNKDTLLQSEFITPTMIKSINSQLYNNLWAAAQRDLRKAEKVTFIGYSLPIADFELRYMLQRCIPSNVEIDVILHNSDDPKKVTPEHVRELLPESRYRDLFVKNKINFYYDGFAEYFEKLVVE